MTNTSVRLVHGDALEGIKHVTSDSVDLVVTSPPYNINLKSRNNYTENYFDNLDETEYRNRIILIIKELARVVKPSGSIWINMKSRWLDADGRTVSATEGSLEPPTWMLDDSKKTGLFLKNLIIWNYDINSDT
nr:DNA methyltransferase [Candidatus Sigynarchaeota archaeon]